MFVGIDYDSFDIYTVVVDEDTGTFESLNRAQLGAGPGDSFDRARRVRDQLPVPGRWRDAGVIAAGIEATLSRERRSIAALSRVQGAILACLPRDLLVLPLTAQEWKRDTVGRSNASKADVAAWAQAHGMGPALKQDYYDAFCIARAARRRYQERAERKDAA